MKQFKLLGLAAAMVLTLGACGDDDSNIRKNMNTGGGGSGGGDAKTYTVSGKIIDGYIKDAKVCADLNGNNACDDNEPATESGDQGDYTLNASVNLDNVTILARGTEKTRDTDRPNTPLTNLCLSAKGSDKDVTPFTTVKNEAGEDALENVADALNVDKEKLKGDYVKAEDKAVQNGAQILTGAVCSAVADAKEKVAGEGLTSDQVSKVIAIAVKNGIKGTKEAVGDTDLSKATSVEALINDAIAKTKKPSKDELLDEVKPVTTGAS